MVEADGEGLDMGAAAKTAVCKAASQTSVIPSIKDRTLLKKESIRLILTDLCYSDVKNFTPWGSGGPGFQVQGRYPRSLQTVKLGLNWDIVASIRSLIANALIQLGRGNDCALGKNWVVIIKKLTSRSAES
jgi:hypothetical protein